MVETVEEFGQKLSMMKTVSDDDYEQQSKPPSKKSTIIKTILIVIFSIAAILVWLNYFNLI